MPFQKQNEARKANPIIAAQAASSQERFARPNIARRAQPMKSALAPRTTAAS